MDNRKTKAFCLKEVYKSFKNIRALVNVSVYASFGEIVSIVGDNGAGKSTLIKILSGALKPDSGEIEVKGETHSYLNTKLAINLGISTVYQDLALGDTMNVSENIFLGREIIKFGILQKEEMLKKSRNILDELEVNIPDLLVPVGDLSGGQRQSVAVARLINSGGSIFIFDEPTAAMGITESKSILDLMVTLSKKGFAVIFVSHNLNHVFDISNRIYVLKNGHISDEIYTKYSSVAEVTDLIMNLEVDVNA